MTSLTTRITELSVRQANEIYKKADYPGRASPSDLLYGVTCKGQPVSVARLLEYEHHLLLRNLCTLPLYRHQGFATLLLRNIGKVRNEKIYLFPLKNLVPFYLQCGFTPVEEAQLPNAILTAWKNVKRNQPGTQPMAL